MEPSDISDQSTERDSAPGTSAGTWVVDGGESVGNPLHRDHLDDTNPMLVSMLEPPDSQPSSPPNYRRPRPEPISTAAPVANSSHQKSLSPVGAKVSVAEAVWLRPKCHISKYEHLSQLTALWNMSLKRCVLLNRLTHPELDFVLSATRPVKTKVGQSIYEEGDLPLYFYLVARGRYRATVAQRNGQISTAREYGECENFGSCEMLNRHGTRTSSCVVLDEGLVWAIPLRVVDIKLRIPPRPSIPRLLDHAMDVKLFRALSLGQLQQVCRCAKAVNVWPGNVVCRQGDPARAIYTILGGSLYTSIEGSDFSLTLGTGESLGESALAAEEEQRVRSSSVFSCSTGATVLIWPVSCLETAVGFELQAESVALQNRKLIERSTCGTTIPSLAKSLDRNQVDLLLDAMVLHTFQPKEVVVSEGTVDEALHIICSGEAAVRKAQGSKVDVATLRREDCFGEQSLLRADAMKRTRRKTTIYNSGGKPLVTFTIGLDAILALPFMQAWLEALASAVFTDGTAGIDALVVERVQAAGGNVASITNAAARTNTKEDDKKRGKGRASKEGAPASAPSPAGTGKRGKGTARAAAPTPTDDSSTERTSTPASASSRSKPTGGAKTRRKK